MKLFFDGGYRPATGMELAVVVGGDVHVRRDLGPGSGMDAEWLALIEAVRIARERGLVDPVLLGDALAVIRQATGIARCPPSCTAHLAAFHALARPAGRLRLRYVRRTQNLAGIALARLHPR